MPANRPVVQPLVSLRVFAASLLVFWLPACAEDRDDLVRALSEREANEILVLLEDLEPEKVAETSRRTTEYRITVPSEVSRLALARLVEAGLPRAVHGGFESLLEDKPLIPGEADERARWMHALSGEVARTLEAITGIVEARVHIVLPERSRWAEASLPLCYLTRPEFAQVLEAWTESTSRQELEARAKEVRSKRVGDGLTLGKASAGVLLRLASSSLEIGGQSLAATEPHTKERLAEIVSRTAPQLDPEQVHIEFTRALVAPLPEGALVSFLTASEYQVFEEELASAVESLPSAEETQAFDRAARGALVKAVEGRVVGARLVPDEKYFAVWGYAVFATLVSLLLFTQLRKYVLRSKRLAQQLQGKMRS